MPITDPDSSLAAFPMRLSGSSGLAVQFNSNGSIRRMDHGDIMLNLFLGNEVEGGPVNIYLRRLDGSSLSVPLLGPASPLAFRIDKSGLCATGLWQDIRCTLSLRLAESVPAWFWHVHVENVGSGPARLDLIHTQDLALAHYGAVRLNEYYVCQYVDHAPLQHPTQGMVLAARQNQAMGGKYPWCVIGSLRKGISFSTDALQFHGLATRGGALPVGLREGLPGRRLQHEHALAAIQDAPCVLEPGETAALGFFGWFETDHPQATSADDLTRIDQALALPEAQSQAVAALSLPTDTPCFAQPAASLFRAASLLEAGDLTDAELSMWFGGARREEEWEDGRLLSFFTGASTHVVLKAKENRVLRPHGHLLRTGEALVPDEASLTTTTWMAGVFHSMVTQGHVSINRFLSTVHGYLSLFRSHGQRVFVELADRWHLLDLPSAYAITPSACRWLYKHDGGLLEVVSAARPDRHELTLTLTVLDGAPLRFLVSHHVAINGDDGAEAIPVQFTVDGTGVAVGATAESDVGRRFPKGVFRIDPLPGTRVERWGGDELLYADGRSRREPFLCLKIGPTASVGLRITGRLIPEDVAGDRPAIPAPSFPAFVTPRSSDALAGGVKLHPPIESLLSPDVDRLGEIIPWFAHDALIHYLAPRGLEQYTGGGWGTRDVTQGPVEMLLALDRSRAVHDLLLRVYRNQNPDGDWPQWFMFFERERNIRPVDAHGDIVFWPVLALASYLLHTEDAVFLDEAIPFFTPEGESRAGRMTLWAHVERALQLIERRFIPGTRLVAYGHGDWNDSLQPVDPAMRERMCSTWTVTLHYQTLKTLALALHRVGLAERADYLNLQAANVLADFRKWLLIDGVLAGFAYFHTDGRVDYLIHPRDQKTGLTYSLLPMIHAVSNGMLTPDEARFHLGLIAAHLLGPDGARLFDHPLEYRGGPQRFFQRAESSSFFGREIGLMYTHAHLRYAEALAYYGDANGFFRALCLANPIAIRSLVPAARLRQANCYYSSSDAAFDDRYQAYAEYERVLKGEVPLEGGWRVYSSGPGIALGLILCNFLGLYQTSPALLIDPVMPKDLDGLRVEWELCGRPVEVTYIIGQKGCGVTSVRLNGVDLPLDRRPNPYRVGAAVVSMRVVRDALVTGLNRLVIQVG